MIPMYNVKGEGSYVSTKESKQIRLANASEGSILGRDMAHSGVSPRHAIASLLKTS